MKSTRVPMCKLLRQWLIPSMVSLLATGCASHDPYAPHNPRYSAQTLLDGSLLIGDPIAAATPEPSALMASPAMHAFAAQSTQRFHADSGRLQALLRGMRDAGYLDFDYQHDATLPAAEVFDDKRGNCLSYTMMFVAMARSVGLTVRFQVVDIPPVWNAAGDLVSVDEHVNAVVQDVRIDTRNKQDFVVDFNIADYRSSYPQAVIEDAEIFARYYSNRAVTALLRGADREAFALLKRAIAESPTLAAAWINLGTLYSRAGHPAAASATYHHVLSFRPDHPSALNNLARYYYQIGETERAAFYDHRSRRHRLRNPYYHYQVGLAALAAGQPGEATDHVERALRLDNLEHRFHHLQARIHARNGNLEASRRSLSRAQALAASDNVRARYTRKLELLAAPSGG